MSSAASVSEMQPGDYVKTGSNTYREITGTYGVASSGRLSKPSEGFFGVHTTSGDVSGWEARSYIKRDDLPTHAHVVGA